MKYSEIVEDYLHDEGYADEVRVKSEDVVKRPGKFEGEARYVPYYYMLSMLCGGADIQDAYPVDIMRVKETDVMAFPELEGREFVVLAYTDSGFVIELDDTRIDEYIEEAKNADFEI